VTAEVVPRLAEEAAKQWTAQFNPRPISAADFQQLYEAAFSNRGSIPSVRLQRA
jgi:alcohol dehydrogenase